MILLEEANATTAQLKRYWAKIRETGDPKTSPAVDALAEILVAQSATALAIGGPEMRENFSTGILVHYTLSAWRVLVPEVSPIPMPTEHPGRVQVVTRGRAQETQVLNLSNADAREWAMSGIHTKGTTGPFLQKTATPAAPATDAGSTSTQPLPPAPVAEPGVDRTSLPTPGASTRRPRPQAPATPQPTARRRPPRTPPRRSLPTPWSDCAEPSRTTCPRSRSTPCAERAPMTRTSPTRSTKRGAELLYRVGDLKRWARNRPGGASGTTDLD
ncbi:hypothetical protein [Streptomyces sp. NPDC056323]|uniref:hypothetical protein n=1 Tax=Streptomyces sp. NPDC056323 TaxID=3345784 RepID=UPI0035DE6EF1